jgi:catalase
MPPRRKADQSAPKPTGPTGTPEPNPATKGDVRAQSGDS